MVKNLKSTVRLALCFAMALIIVIPFLPEKKIWAEGNNKNGSEELKIYFDEPVSKGPLSSGAGNQTDIQRRWQQLSLPIGNSMMGANIYGEVNDEHLTLNLKSLWSGGPSTSRPNYDSGNVKNVEGMTMAEYVRSIQNKFLTGNSVLSADVEKIKGAGAEGYGGFEPFGDIYFDFNITGIPEKYSRYLDLKEAVSGVKFTADGTEYHREFLASYPDKVIAIKFKSDRKNKLNFDVRFPVNFGNAIANGDTLMVSGKQNDNQMKINGQLKVISQGGTVVSNGDRLTISDADETVIFVSADTDYSDSYPTYCSGETEDDLQQRIGRIINRAANKGYDQVRKTAVEDYKEIFDRAALNLGQSMSDMTTDQLLTAYKAGTANERQSRALEVLLFQYGRYLQIASSREGDLLANRQGVWTNLSSAGGYELNGSLQMNYWPVFVTNMAECAGPLIDFVDGLREPGRVTAKTYFGVKSDSVKPENGFNAHFKTNPFGWTAPGWEFSSGWSPAAVPWILQNCYEYYEYTGNKNVLRNKIYPILKEQAIFFQQILKEDPASSRRVSVPSFSPDHGPYTAGNTYEQTLIWQLFHDVSEAAEVLGTDQELIKEWQKIMKELKPLEIGEDGQIKEWYCETFLGSVKGSDRKSDCMSHLLGLFPGDLISTDNKKLLDAAVVSLKDRGNGTAGWSMAQRLNAWARTGDREQSYAVLMKFIKSSVNANLWSADVPLQLSGNFGYTSGVAEMLIQSNTGYIKLLPALPGKWQEGSVKGLMARGNFEVSMDWKKGKLGSASVLSKAGGKCTLSYLNIEHAVVKHNGTMVPTNMSDGHMSFSTEAGKLYTVQILADKKALEETITEGEKLNSSEYTLSSWETFKDVLEEAKKVQNDDNADQESVDQAVENLREGKKTAHKSCFSRRNQKSS